MEEPARKMPYSEFHVEAAEREREFIAVTDVALLKFTVLAEDKKSLNSHT